MRVVAVSDLASYLRALVEDDYELADLWVEGEVSNYSQSANGHRYFTLKDESSALRCVLFARRGRTLDLPPMRNGMMLLAHGRVSFYEARGDLQLYVDEVRDAGVGHLHLRFEQLKARLDAEGLFAQERKRELPRCPETIGVVTSLQAAALRDILRTLRLRCPLVRVVVAPAMVQGEGAAKTVADAIDTLSSSGVPDVILVARGGGSIEELWAFNEEVVARAIARCAVPVVTGVGHETDFTIADFVADVRAATPTAAAATVVPDAQVWRENLDLAHEELSTAMDRYLSARRSELDHRSQRLDQAAPVRRLAEAHRRLTATGASLDTALDHYLALRQEQVRGRGAQLHMLSPLATLGRGFAVVRRQDDGTLVTTSRQVTPGTGLSIAVSDGSFAAVAGPRQPESADTTPPTAHDSSYDTSSGSTSLSAIGRGTRAATRPASATSTPCGERMHSMPAAIPAPREPRAKIVPAPEMARSLWD